MNANRRSAPSRGPVHRSSAGSPGALALPEAGDVVAGKYRIEKVVGEGGMGIVYAAHHLALDQRVAIKLLLVDSPTGEDTVERFVREAQAAARLRSEHVVRVTDAGALDNGVPFLVMEYLQGCDLAELADLDGPLPPADVADYMLQVLAALAQAHMAGIVHRDLKPANLFLALRDDGSNIIKILDFGISKQRSERTRSKELTGKAVLGTPAYMSPEQLRSSKTVDARADIWSLGVVMYELLAGTLPFDGESPGEVFAAVLEKTPASLRVHRPDLRPAWDDVVMRCLERAPDARFADVGEMARALVPLGSGRWAQTVPAIERVLARAHRACAATNAAHVDAAVAAAIKSLPPPMLLAPAVRFDADGRGNVASHPVTLGTGKTLVADLLPARPEVSRRLSVVGAAAVTIGVLLFAGIGFTSRTALHRVREDARAMSQKRSPGGPAPAPERSPGDAPAARAGSAAEDPAAIRVPSAAPPEPTAPPPIANRRPAAVPGKKPARDPRPTFLKSWR